MIHQAKIFTINISSFIVRKDSGPWSTGQKTDLLIYDKKFGYIQEPHQLQICEIIFPCVSPSAKQNYNKVNYKVQKHFRLFVRQ